MFEERNMIEELDLSFHPLTQKLWRDFEMLFGNNGACGGCWCMFWKLRGKAFDESRGDTARQMQKSVVDSKTVPGLLAYSEGYPVGWIAIEPRSAYPKLAHSRVLKPVDDKEVWSVTCFFTEWRHDCGRVSTGIKRESARPFCFYWDGFCFYQGRFSGSGTQFAHASYFSLRDSIT